MTDRQVRDEIMTLFLAGHETTAVSLSWTWYLLAQHPEVEARLADELRSVLGGRLPTVADLPRLRYTEMVVMESMRLYPPAFTITRRVAEPLRGRRPSHRAGDHADHEPVGRPPRRALVRRARTRSGPTGGSTTWPSGCRATPTSRSAAARASASATRSP